MLSGEEIIAAVEKGDIVISPFNKDNVNPNSYNLTLGDELVVYTEDVLDAKKENKTKTIKIPEEGYVLSPGNFYLAKTREYTENEVYVPEISGRSSVGRIGLNIHISSGFGNIGYKGAWTLQISCVIPTKVYKGMQIGQIYFFPVVGETYIRYKGKYNNKGEINICKEYLDN